MSEIEFTYVQKATQTFSGLCRVPDEIVAKGNDAIRAWLMRNQADWVDDSDAKLLDTFYGEVHGVTL